MHITAEAAAPDTGEAEAEVHTFQAEEEVIRTIIHRTRLLYLEWIDCPLTEFKSSEPMKMIFIHIL